MRRTLRCLIVEPNPIEATRLSDLLVAQKQRPTVVRDLLSGLEALGQQEYDLAIVALDDPAAAGPEFFRTLREELARESTAVILLGPPPPERILAELDALTVLPRPVDERRLTRAVQWLLDLPTTYVPFLERDFRRFAARLEQVSGLVFDPKRRGTLEEALRQRMRLVYSPDFDDYFARLTVGAAAGSEEQRLVHLLTIGETSFFRNAPQFDVLREELLPRLRQELAARGRRIRLWSAGCSTGEEPYTMAMVALDIFPDASRWDLNIQATDINARSLAAARRGIYDERLLKSIPGTYVDRYFERQPDGSLRVNDRVRALVRFGELNLQTDEYPRSVHAIFCRNVLIYFKRPSIEAVLKRMHAALVPGGVLFLGHSENLLGFDVPLETVHSRSTYFYVRRETDLLAGEPGDTGPSGCARPGVEEGPASTVLGRAVPQLEGSATGRPAGTGRARVARPGQPEFPPPLPSPGGGGRGGGQSRAKREPALVAGTPQSPASGRGASAGGATQTRAAERPQAARAFEAEREFGNLLAPGQGTAHALVGRGFLAANQGKSDEALEYANAALEADPLLAEAHFLMGVLKADAGDAGAAMESFNRALFLDPDLPMAHYHLAHLQARGRSVEAARRSFQNAIELLERGIEAHFTGGFPPEQLLAICRQGLAGLGQAGDE